MMNVFRVCLWLTVFSLSVHLIAGQSCISESGNEVDWWIIIKVPKDSSSSVERLSRGRAFLYLDSVTAASSSSFAVSSLDLNSTQGALGRTLTQTYRDARLNSQGYVFFNDEEPDGTVSSSLAHSKGVLSYNVNTNKAFYLIHSMPGFANEPNLTSNLTTPFYIDDSACIYGQSFICVSHTLTDTDALFYQIAINNPQVYGNKWPTTTANAFNFSTAMPNSYAFQVAGTRYTATSMNQTYTFASNGEKKQIFTHFAKNPRWNQDLYANFTSIIFQSNLIIETWMRPYSPSFYPPATVYENVNVQTLHIPSEASIKQFRQVVQWTETQDHAKWAMAQAPAKSMVCVGDINKQPSQYKRGGGTMCLSHPNVHQAFQELLVNYDTISPLSDKDKVYPTIPAASINMLQLVNPVNKDQLISVVQATYPDGSSDAASIFHSAAQRIIIQVFLVCASTMMLLYTF